MRIYLVEPFRFPDERRVVVALNPDEACRICGIEPGAARVKDQTRFALRPHHMTDSVGAGSPRPTVGRGPTTPDPVGAGSPRPPMGRGSRAPTLSTQDSALSTPDNGGHAA